MVWRPFLAPRFDLSAETQPAPAELPRGHIPALDSIRGLAIVVVMLYRFGGGSDGPASAIEHSPLIELGAHGVDLFFVLSGFLITGILFDTKGKAHYFRNFYLRRALRIFPLYYAALAVMLWLLPLVSTTFSTEVQPAIDAQGWLWLYGANVLQSVRGSWCLGPLNHFWSLAIEEHFYLAWPAVIYFASRRTAMRICTGLFGFSVFIRVFWLAFGGNDVAAEVLTPLRMDGLVLGAWLALAVRSSGGLGSLVRWARPSLMVFGLMALIADLFGRRWFGLPYVCWACACGALLVRVVAAPQASWLSALGNLRALQFCGKYSYAMYVFQLPLIYLLAPIITAPGLAESLSSSLLGQLVYCLTLFAVTTAAAWASWQLFERHCLRLKHHFE
jgi:peptidoglycan/LPS O-acetylase OafA/YrhL